MNCKPGDLAVMVKSCAGNEGKIVRCVELLPRYSFGDPWREMDAWKTEPMLTNIFGDETPTPDSYLRPIRDPGDDATDETLEWLPVPTKEGQPA